MTFQDFYNHPFYCHAERPIHTTIYAVTACKFGSFTIDEKL